MCVVHVRLLGLDKWCLEGRFGKVRLSSVLHSCVCVRVVVQNSMCSSVCVNKRAFLAALKHTQFGSKWVFLAKASITLPFTDNLLPVCTFCLHTDSICICNESRGKKYRKAPFLSGVSGSVRGRRRRSGDLHLKTISKSPTYYTPLLCKLWTEAISKICSEQTCWLAVSSSKFIFCGTWEEL